MPATDQRMDPHANAPALSAGKPLGEATRVFIMLHGRGASARDILGLGEQIADPVDALLAPQATGSTWYPNSFLAPFEQNEPYLSSALGRVTRLVEEVVSEGVARDRIVLCGFSQGACLASEFVARHADRYAALIAFTGGLIGPPGTHFQYPGSLQGTPILLSSGDPDPHVPWSRVEETAAVFRAMGAKLEMLKQLGRPHTVLPLEVAAARSLLSRR